MVKSGEGENAKSGEGENAKSGEVGVGEGGKGRLDLSQDVFGRTDR